MKIFPNKQTHARIHSPCELEILWVEITTKMISQGNSLSQNAVFLYRIRQKHEAHFHERK